MGPLLKPADGPHGPHGTPPRCVERQPDVLAEQLDWELLKACKPALEQQERVQQSFTITNRNRTGGALLSYFVTKKYGEAGLPEDSIYLQFNGSAGQSFGAAVA